MISGDTGDRYRHVTILGMNRKLHSYTIAVSALIGMFSAYFDQHLLFSIFKPLTTILIILFLVFNRADTTKYTIMVVIALIACLGGDVLLLNEAHFAFGLGSFLLAHLLFAYLFYCMRGEKLVCWPLLPLVVITGGFYQLLLPHLGDLGVPVAVYQCCIVVMAWLGINVYLSRKNEVGKQLAIAALLFVFSDSIIAVDKFLAPFDFSIVIILTTYWLSIFMIAKVFTQPKDVLIER